MKKCSFWWNCSATHFGGKAAGSWVQHANPLLSHYHQRCHLRSTEMTHYQSKEKRILPVTWKICCHCKFGQMNLSVRYNTKVFVRTTRGVYRENIIASYEARGGRLEQTRDLQTKSKCWFYTCDITLPEKVHVRCLSIIVIQSYVIMGFFSNCNV